jgi:Neuraminidase-like domain/Salmonella virulence plasmid 28.1kDa A protein
MSSRAFLVEGQIFFEDGLPAAGITVRLYRQDFGGEVSLLGEKITDDKGYYKVDYSVPNEKSANIEVHTIDRDGKEISLSETKFNADRNQVLNLVAPANIRPTPVIEYQKLADSLEGELGSIDKLAEAQEKGERHDLSVLHHATGWDARLISLLARATKLSAETGIQKDILYALLRVGLPSEKQMLASVDSLVVEKALKKAKEAGIINSDVSIENAKNAFERFAHSTLLDAKAPGALSSTADLLNTSGLLNGERKEKSIFENLYLNHRGSPEDLWQKARDKGIPHEKIKGLRLQGKLAYLTLNNADLSAKLQEKISSLENLSKLAELDFYKEEAWKDLLNNGMAGGDPQALEKFIPPAYEREKNVNDSLDAYAADLARKVRLSFPTKVVRQMIKKGEMKLSEDSEDNKSVVSFLDKAEKIGFQLGRVPIDAFVENNKEHLIPSNTPDEKIKAAKENIKKLQRLYQITPSNKSLNILLEQGFTSANDVVAFTKEDFLSSFGHLFSSLEEADLVYRKSQQVSAVTSNLFTTARLMDSTPEIYAISLSAEERENRENSKKELIKHYPTMESLFGSLDFCECEHCRSVLSPAAYFVDLLKFIEPGDKEWESFLANWDEKHNHEPYMNDWNRDEKEKKPYHALIERRPDLPHLPLTCENTNTALPYIDLVNEIFEYYVAYGNLDNYNADTPGDITTPELLAEPQNILPIAYDELKKARYPLTLPFDLWLETVRMFFNHFGMPLWKVLNVFRLREELFSLPPKPVIENPTNITNATLTVPDADAAIFKVGNSVTYHDVSANALHTETKIISSIAPITTDAGNPTGKTLITLSGTWITPPAANGDLLVLADRTYNFANIFYEYLGITPAEHALFSDPNPLAKWWKLYGYGTEEEATTEAYDPETGQRIDLNSAKTLSRRLDVSYKELVDLLQTGFINPKLDEFLILRKLGLDAIDVFRYYDDPSYRDKPFTEEEKRAIKEHLEDYTKRFNRAGFNAEEELKKRLQSHDFDKILVLNPQNTDCNFDKTVLSHADTTQPDKIVFLKINLFVRLWKKLGWTIEETDQVIKAFLPKNSLPITDQSLGVALQTVLVYISHLKEINEHVSIGENSLIRLLPLWSNISTTGKSPLYDQLFLTSHNMQRADPVFDDPLGKYLLTATAGGGTLVRDHLLSLQASLNLTADEIKQILKDAKKNFDNEPLTLETVSLLYRYGLLAKALKISIHELISLKELSGLDIFKAIEPKPITSINQDHPFKQTLEFVNEVVEKVKESGFKVDDLNFLLKHRLDDPLGKYRSQTDSILTLIQRLAAEISRIQEEYVLITDDLLQEKLKAKLPMSVKPEVIIKLMRELAGNTNGNSPITDEKLREKIDALLPSPSSNDLFELIKKLIADLRSEYVSLTDDTIRQKLSLVLTADVVDRFFGFWKDTIEFSAKKEQVEANRKLNPSKYQVGSIRVSYDPTRKWQHVVHVGVLTNEKKDKIINNKDLIPGPTASPEENDAYNNFIELINKIAIESQLQPRAFFDGYLKGFLTYDHLYGSSAAGLSEEAKRHKVLGAILPFIQHRLIRQLVVQTLAANLNSEPKLTEMLVSDARLLSSPLDPNRGALLDAFTATADNGVSVNFFNNTGNQIGQTRNVHTADTAAKVDNVPIKPSEAKSTHFDGYFEVPISGVYRFFLVFSKKGIEARFRLLHLPDSLISGKATDDQQEMEQFTELEARKLYRFSIDVDNLSSTAGDVSLLVQGENTPKGSLSQLTLYPYTSVEWSIRSHVLLAKAVQLIQSLGLSDREVQYILTHKSKFDDINLSKLPTIENDSLAAADLIKLFKQFLLLADYAHLKRDLSSGTDDLIGIFENAHKTYPEITNAVEAKLAHLKPLAQLTRRNVETVRAVTERMGFVINVTTTNVNNKESGYRVDMQDIVNVEKLWRLWEALQVVEKLGVPVEKILLWATPEPDFSIARDLRNTIKSRYERENWQGIAQSIFDKLRQRKRDALVAYILHKEGYQRIEQLFEDFLIDPGMEPIVQTSRLWLAISSVQLFVQRCLLNLEKRVHPSAIINSHQWEWMKRYRLWEANRKIFLFPENWLEPEFRDDKSNLFQELEGVLLQGDVSSDLVEDAFFSYLKKLEELARLDIVTMYLEEKPALKTLHVIGRTFSLPHKYFYRRYSNHMWTPWEPVTAEIESDHVVAVVWKERLHLFWLTFLEKAGKAYDTVSSKSFKDIGNEPISSAESDFVDKKVEIRLNWCEYFQGQWTTRESSGLDDPLILSQSEGVVETHAVFIDVSEATEQEGALKISLFTYGFSSSVREGFLVISKNSPPKHYVEEFPFWGFPYGRLSFYPSPTSATRRNASDILEVRLWGFREDPTSDRPVKVEPYYKNILENENKKFSLLMSSKFYDYLRINDLYRLSSLSEAKDAISLYEKALSIPFFYQDELNTFFVEPKLAETSIASWEEWIIRSNRGEVSLHLHDIDGIPLEISIPQIESSGERMLSLYPIDPIARYKIKDKKDWVTDPTTVIIFDDRLIGSDGGIDFKVLSAEDNNSIRESDRLVNVNSGSELVSDSVIIVGSANGYGEPLNVHDDQHKLSSRRSLLLNRGLNVIGASGINSVLLQWFDKEKNWTGGRFK